MVTLSKGDLRGIFVLLGLAFLFDSIPSGFVVPLGVAGFLVLLGIIWLSSNDYGNSIKNIVADLDQALFLRIGLGLTLIGILVANLYVILIAFVIGAVLLFLPGDVINVDLMKLQVEVVKNTRKQTTR
jgi:hypothetical protein